MSYHPNQNEQACAMSPFALITVTGTEAHFVKVSDSEWGTSKINITLEAEDSRDVPFLDSLRSLSNPVFVAYRTDVAMCKVVEGTRVIRSGQPQWMISFRIENSDFTPSSEIGFTSVSPDELAVKRARRLLLNENPFAEEGDVRNVRDLNKLTEEIFIRGQGTPIAILRSPFPTLFTKYGDQPQRFVGFSWIDAVFLLKLSACVAEIITLKLTLA